MPAAILQPPFFRPRQSSALNYGSVGMILAHEVTHAFTPAGAEWNSNGTLGTGRLDSQSREDYRRMAGCLESEYSSFCPFNSSYPQAEKSNCVDGAETVNENWADVGGVNLAFEAYRQRVATDGDEDGEDVAAITGYPTEQLFFLSFGRTWCDGGSGRVESVMRHVILRDSHAPQRYRVLGALRNTAAFGSAFNCTVGREYTPREYCGGLWA